MYGQKTAFLLIFWQIQMKLLQVEMEIYHLKMHFKGVRHQMSHCYLSSKSKNNRRKWYFEYFIADYFPTLNKKRPCITVHDERHWLHVNLLQFISFLPSSSWNVSWKISENLFHPKGAIILSIFSTVCLPTTFSFLRIIFANLNQTNHSFLI